MNIGFYFYWLLLLNIFVDFEWIFVVLFWEDFCFDVCNKRNNLINIYISFKMLKKMVFVVEYKKIIICNRGIIFYLFINLFFIII